MNLPAWFKPKISREQATFIAREECFKRGLIRVDPIIVKSKWRTWMVITNVGWKGDNAIVVIRKDTGEIVKFEHPGLR